jgi:hypothetical protein
MAGLMSLAASTTDPSPHIDERRALIVLSNIDRILAREAVQAADREVMYVDLGRCLCEVRARQFWLVERLASFDAFIASRFPGSRRKAYYLMAIHEQLPKRVKAQLRGIGWSKAIELNRVARKDRERFDADVWLHRARTMKKEDFKDEVERHINGVAPEPHELLYFKVYKSQLKVIEQGLETAAMMLGSDRSRGYCLEMICADFLSGAHLSPYGDGDVLVLALKRTFELIGAVRQDSFLKALNLSRNR